MSLIYLNSGSYSITPRPVLDSIRTYQLEFEQNPTANLFGAWERLWRSQVTLAERFHADPKDIFLRTNVTLSLNAFLLGIKSSPDWRGGEIAYSELEYGAIVNLCRFRAEREGMTLRSLRMPASPGELLDLTPASLAQSIVSQLRPETRILLLSHVTTSNGLVLPIREIARETRKRGILFVVDGAHGAGAVELDFRLLDDVDFYGGNLHKWMMGPKGTSFGWVPKRHHERIQPLHAGWTTYEFPPAFQSFGEQYPFQGRMLLSASFDFSSFFAIPDMLHYRESSCGGERKIRARLQELSQYALSAVVKNVGWALLSPEDSSLRGPMVTFELPQSLAHESYGLMHRIREDHELQISVTPVRGQMALRISPHIYNTESEIDRAAMILKSIQASS